MDIGLFDSGIGGLTVLKELVSKFPNNRFFYLADTANLPYGNKTPEQILSYADAKMKWMKDIGVDMVSIACNTTDATLSKIDVSGYQRMFKNGIVNIIKPTARGILELTPAIKKIGVIATEATTKSNAFNNAFKELSNNVEVMTIPCPELVTWIESDDRDYEKGYKLISNYLEKLIGFEMEGLIYGCTHYPLASDVIQDVLNKNGKNDVMLFNPAFFVSSEIARKVNFDTTIQGFEAKFFVTEISAAARLQQAVKNLFGFIPEVQVADLKKYS